jgi:hypothetical protein
LAAVQLRNPLLQRMRIIDIANALNRNNMFPINTHEREQTRIYCQVLYPLFSISLVSDLEDDGAGSAPALSAAEFRAF